MFSSPSKRVLTWNLVLFALVTVLFFLNFYQRTMFFRPNSIHQWRQSDCLSIAKNYYEEDMNFFKPRIHYQGVRGGRAVSEFPILNYTAAVLWKIFGEHEFIYRLLEYFLFIGAVFMLFNTLLRQWKSGWLALFAAGMMLVSPLLTYYNLNFLADVPALSIAVMSFCCLFNFIAGGKVSKYYLALFLGALAVLMKASALIPFVLTLLVGASGLLKNPRYHLTNKVFQNKKTLVFAIVAACILVFSWYQYALYYNLYNSNRIFLLTVLPIWEMDERQIVYNCKMLFNVHFPLFMNKPMFFFLFFVAIYVISRFRVLDRFLKCAFLLSAAYFIFYLLFFFQVFGVHDYYLINLFIFPVIVFFCAIQLLVASNFQLSGIRFIRIFVTFTLLLSSLNAAAMYRLRTIEDDKLADWVPFVTQEELGLAKYLFWTYSTDVKKLENFTPALRAHGIKREDKVLSIPDQSFDISLYMMDQKGYALARHDVENDPSLVHRFSYRVKYVVVSDTNLKHTESFQNASRRMQLYFTEGPVQVFKIKSAR